MNKNKVFLQFIPYLIGILGLFARPIYAQSLLAAPMVINYTKQVYKGGTQTWDICTGKNGLVFYANNNGLLLFDGKDFSNYPLPKNTILRSIFYDEVNQRIYAGGQSEIGYFQLEKNGKINFQSLAHLLSPNNKGFRRCLGNRRPQQQNFL